MEKSSPHIIYLIHLTWTIVINTRSEIIKPSNRFLLEDWGEKFHCTCLDIIFSSDSKTWAATFKIRHVASYLHRRFLEIKATTTEETQAYSLGAHIINDKHLRKEYYQIQTRNSNTKIL